MNNEKIWGLLIEAITQNKVIPIIGDEFFFAEIDGQRVPYINFLIEKLSSKFPIPNGYSQDLLETSSTDFNMIADSIRISNIINSQMYGLVEKSTNLYYEINLLVETTPIICDESLIEFLDKVDFPVILTTSFLPGIENALKKRGRNIITKTYDKSPRIDIQEYDRNIIYYLFGKCNKLNKGYMVTEDDLLDYIHYWHNIDYRPNVLSNLLSSKFLLVLGCDYPNWLFRFFWHSIKNFNFSSNNEGIKGVVAANVLETDEELSRFLSRLQTHSLDNCNEVIENLLKILPERNQEKDNADIPTINNTNKPDVFISYAHEDTKIAKDIANIFETFGAKVWFDTTSLVGSDLYDDIIRNKIEECERFVPILSTYTETAKRGYFRKEWALSIDENKFRLGSPYISPIVIDSVNISSQRFPKEFKDAHILDYNDSEFKYLVKKIIRSFR